MRRFLLLCGLLVAVPAALPAPTEAQAPPSVAESIAYLRKRADLMGTQYAVQATAWRARADELEKIAASGKDPYPEQRGKIVTRAYTSRITGTQQGYAVYLPPNYDETKTWPLVIVLHGGSSNGNLFLGVVLGNNMNWKEYPTYWWNEFVPQWQPDCIVVSPDGFGQVLWRWMGEQDVLDVIADTERHYRVDEDRVVLAGLSNGGVGAYSIGTRHAWRFSVVQAMAGAPSWLQYVGGKPRTEELRAIRPLSGIDLAENIVNTDFRYYHGHLDTGPMKPRFVEEWEARLKALELPAKGTWYDAGHDILYMVEKHGRTFASLGEVHRNPHPKEVRVVSGDYRAARQHWLELTRIDDYPSLATLRGTVEGSTVRVTTERARAFALHVRDALPQLPKRVTVEIDGKKAYDGDPARLGDIANFVRRGDGFALGFPDKTALEKKPGVSGPLTDAYYDRTIHVFGTTNPSTRAALEATARTGAKGWPLWLWNFEQPVVADTAVTPEMMHAANLVLYTTGADNAVYERIKAKLPIRVESGAVVVGEKRYDGARVGTRFIYPNPLAPEHYVIVQAGVSPEAVQAGHKLPDFVPDYVVYNGAVAGERPRLVTSGKATLAMGFFDDHWQLVTEAHAEAGETPGGDEHEGATIASALGVPPAPPTPPPPTTFAAPETDAAGKAAREIAARIAKFPSYRSKIAGAVWTSTESSVWQIRGQDACEAGLRDAHVSFERYDTTKPRVVTLGTPVAAPIVLTAPVGGVTFKMMHSDRKLLVSCELAARLPELARVLRAHGVSQADVISTYRDKPFSSFHTFGLALDISMFHFDDGASASVKQDFVMTPNAQTCRAPEPAKSAAKRLLALACDIAKLDLFSSVLTPNYNEGHRDHFHVDLRPDDPRHFVR